MIGLGAWASISSLVELEITRLFTRGVILLGDRLVLTLSALLIKLISSLFVSVSISSLFVSVVREYNSRPFILLYLLLFLLSLLRHLYLVLLVIDFLIVQERISSLLICRLTLLLFFLSTLTFSAHRLPTTKSTKCRVTPTTIPTSPTLCDGL